MELKKNRMEVYKGTNRTGDIRYIDKRILKEKQNETEKLSYSVNWLSNWMRFGPAKLDNRLRMKKYRKNP